MINIKDVAISYQTKAIIENLSVSIPTGKVTTIIGPNGCGKSTLLKAIARILQVSTGAIYLDGKDIWNIPSIEVAKKMAILPQSAEAPTGLTVKQLITYGRFPHQGAFGRLKKEDYDAVERAIEWTNLEAFADRPIEALSGGQRQRAWIAMALAQDTTTIILDEPTTYLDMTYQLDILELLRRFNQEDGKTIVMVLHDLNHASRFSDHLIGMRDGDIVITGSPEEVMTSNWLKHIFNIDPIFTSCPFSGHPICLAYGKNDPKINGRESEIKNK